MIIVISPAKTLDFETPSPTSLATECDFTDDSQKLISTLKNYTYQEIGDMMGISEKLAVLNYNRFQEWELPFDQNKTKQALLAFKGDVYEGIDATSFKEEDFETTNHYLRILSGLYGILKPFDMILPYRLEMGTKLENERGENLYKFWGSQLTDKLNEDLATSGKVLINLASNEYFKSLQKKNIDAEIITPIFKDEKNGKYKVISFYAKKARGMMTRYIIQNKLTKPEELKNFNGGGYSFNPDLSVKKNEWVFTR